MIYDTLAGPALAERIPVTEGWREFVLYRAAPYGGEVRLVFALTGLGEAWLDDVSITLHDPIGEQAPASVWTRLGVCPRCRIHCGERRRAFPGRRHGPGKASYPVYLPARWAHDRQDMLMDLGLGLPQSLVTAGAVGLGLLVLLVLVIALLRRKRPPAEPPPQDLRINLADLPTPAPPAEGPRLEFYGTPVRLAVLVLAPAGRNNAVPTGAKLTEALDNLLPGLAGVVTAHRPVFRTVAGATEQPGLRDFVRAQVPLPGDRGKGTVWCSAAGRF